MFVIKKRSVIVISVLVLTLITFLVCFTSLDKNPIGSAEAKKPKIVLDAGHGGFDPGVTGKTSGVKESQINLDIVKRTQKLFEDAGFRVVLTRKTDAGLYGIATKNLKKKDMQKRKEIIQEENPDFVISVHLNEYSLSSRRGGQVFFLKENQESQNLATLIQKEINELYQGVKDYNALSADLFMLKCTNAPSVIVECGFLSNPEDEKLLLTETFRDQVSYAIFKGVVGYLTK
jgi:N-acetylmuramoyl-L-alanine amidase